MTIVLAILGMLSVDLKVIFIPGKYEEAVTIYYLIVIYYFVMEMILNTIIELSYIISFHAFIDLLCIVFMFLELENCIKVIVSNFTISFDVYDSIYPDYNQIEKYARGIREFRILHYVKLYYLTVIRKKQYK